MPKRAKKAWRKNIKLDDLYEGIRRTRQELASGGIVREKSDAELFAIDETGGPTDLEPIAEPPKKRRKPLKVDEMLGTIEEKTEAVSYNPKKQPKLLVEPTPSEPQTSYDVWNKVDTIPAPKDLPAPAVLPYSKSAPAQAPTTLQSSKRRLRHREKAVSVPEGGQSYNPTLEEWEDIINRTAIKEQHRLADIAKRERVATPESDDGTPAQDDEEREEEEEQRGESYLGKPVQLRRKTRAQRNKQARLAEEERRRKLAKALKEKRRQVEKLPDLLSQISKTQTSTTRQKKPKELPPAPLEVQLSDELAESLRLLKPEGNLFRDRYRSIVERGIVEPRLAPTKKGRRYPLKYVEKYDYKHWGTYYGK